MLRLNSQAVKNAIEVCTADCLEKSAELITEKVKRMTDADTGTTRYGWTYSVRAEEAVVGNPHKNAVWEEFGTGEYALSGNGRKGGWVYRRKDGEFRHTFGKPPKRPFLRAYEEGRDDVVAQAEKVFKEGMK